MHTGIWDCAVITWRRVGKPEGGGRTRENHNCIERELDVKFNTYKGGGGITFLALFHKLEKWY